MKLLKTIKNIIICFIAAMLFFGVFALAALQESYRLNPPSVQERAEHPILIKFLIGE